MIAKRISALLIATIMMLGFTACGGKKLPELEQNDCWIVAYTRFPSDEYSTYLAQSVHFAVTTDSGKSFTPLYHNYGRLYSKCRFSEENGIISTGIKGIELYKSGDTFIITAKETKRLKDTGVDMETNMFVRWTTEDFMSFTEPELTEKRTQGLRYDTESTKPDASSLDYATADIAALPISRELADKLLEQNKTVEFESLELPDKVTVGSLEELKEVTASVKYTDGSVHEKHIEWNTDGIDFDKDGKYTLTGEVVVRRFEFPVEDHPWADPVITYYNGKYYYIATDDANGNTNFEVREASTPEELFTDKARRSVILSADDSIFSGTFWAPEFHVTGGQMRIFCALSVSGFDPQCYIMSLNDGGDMLNPDDWSSPRRCMTSDGRYINDNPLGDGKSGITLDMTYFEAGSKSYVVWSYRTWAGTDSGSMLMIAEVDPSMPWRLKSDPQLLTRPYYAWEHIDVTDNNEGPNAIVTDDKVYLSYSGGSARLDTYAVGMLIANVGDDLTDVSNWTDTMAPWLASNFVEGEYGCGHNAFFVDEYGDTYITYHGHSSKQSSIAPGIRRVHFRADGSPILFMTDEQDFPESKQNVKISVTVKH